MNEAEIFLLAKRAVNQLIADVEAGRHLQQSELAETIRVCLTHADETSLAHLKWFLSQRAIEGAPQVDG